MEEEAAVGAGPTGLPQSGLRRFVTTVFPHLGRKLTCAAVLDEQVGLNTLRVSLERLAGQAV
jgi:hypothetical protein